MAGIDTKNPFFPQNRFSFSEWSGAVGDLGTMLPLAFALVIFNGYPPERLFFLWGLVYMATGLLYCVPVAVQPLKAMAVIAIAQGFTIEQLSSTSFFYGILLITLAGCGVIRWLEQLFTPPITRGIQVGIGMILLQKAMQMSLGNGLFLGWASDRLWMNLAILFSVLLVLGFFQFYLRKPVSIWIIFLSIGIAFLGGVRVSAGLVSGRIVARSLPQFHFLLPAVLNLIIPQLPLTLGNAVFAACSACHTFWADRSSKVSPTRFAFSIGVSDMLIGVLGGFPICHGAGGIAAHARFGGKTGGTTIILGAILVAISLIKPVSGLLFLIPIPILSALLLFTSLNMFVFIQKLVSPSETAVAIIIGIISFYTRNLSIALMAGLLIEQGFVLVSKRGVALEAGANNSN